MPPRNKTILMVIVFLCGGVAAAQLRSTRKMNFNSNWKFTLDAANGYSAVAMDAAAWRTVILPHDWSIELPFDSASPGGVGGGALRGGIGWYRKRFVLPETDKGKIIFIDFDGVYRNSEVWINGHSLGIRPNGYISFQYDLTPYLNYGIKANMIAVKVDNSKQPNSRWYSGSGIFRNVWLEKVHPVHIAHWGTYITTPEVTAAQAVVDVKTEVRNENNSTAKVVVVTSIFDAAGHQVTSSTQESEIAAHGISNPLDQTFTISQPALWSVAAPTLYKAVSRVKLNGKIVDSYETPFGIRYFNFDIDKGFSLNGTPLKIIGVCDHHDLGALGTAVNKRALQRQLEILKEMGCNGIRTSHNPPAPELLDLCDKMGFIVMDEAFDMWAKQKTAYDYHLYWTDWHKRDLEDQIRRDRNHPCVVIWSVGNEIEEQSGSAAKGDTSGRVIGRELVGIVKSLDTTREIVTANNNTGRQNNIVLSGAFDLVGLNYDHRDWHRFHETWPGKKLIITESISALETRGYYDLVPFDSIRRWPKRWDIPFRNPNGGYDVSAYDNVSAPWGSTHEETLKTLLKYDFVSGMFVWTGFDYIGEPTPYGWPARSSYFGIIDLAGFPKDVYYLYQSLFTNTPVLHIYPYWNWKTGDTVDVVGYYNQADEVELFLNGISLGTRHKSGDDLHVLWRVPFVAGTIRAVSRKDGKMVLSREIKTAGAPARLVLSVDRKVIHADGDDLSYITVTVVDKNGVVVPNADNMIQFAASGSGFIAGVDNGSETSHESFKGSSHTALNGLALAILRSNGARGRITLKATSKGLPSSEIEVEAR